MRRLAFCLVLFSLVACAGARASCGLADPLQGDLQGLPRPELLQEGVSRLIQTHCDCRFPADVRRLVPAGVEGTGNWENAAEVCLGPVEVVEWTKETDMLAAIYVLQAGRPSNDTSSLYFIFASFVEGEWKFSWPAAAGPELHPASP